MQDIVVETALGSVSFMSVSRCRTVNSRLLTSDFKGLNAQQYCFYIQYIRSYQFCSYAPDQGEGGVTMAGSNLDLGKIQRQGEQSLAPSSVKVRLYTGYCGLAVLSPLPWHSPIVVLPILTSAHRYPQLMQSL